jgi:SAM-dependent methyltransferase
MPAPIAQEFSEMSDKREPFCESYYMDGIATGLSNYQCYSWRPELTVKMAKRFLDHLGIEFLDEILDFGCARGYFVRALRELGKNARGCDISKWAIENCDEAVKGFVSSDTEIKPSSFDWIFSKDVLEHMRMDCLVETLRQFNTGARIGQFIIVPLCSEVDGSYLRKEDEQDVTHLIRWPFEMWLKILHDYNPDFIVSGSYYVPDLKEAARASRYSTGFFTLKRIK